MEAKGSWRAYACFHRWEKQIQKGKPLPWREGEAWAAVIVNTNLVKPLFLFKDLQS